MGSFGHKDIIVWSDDFGNQHKISLDAITAFEDGRDNEPTRHAIEDGTDITDHVILMPESVSFEIAQSNTPIEPDGENFEKHNLTLEIRPSQFQPGGFLLVTTAVGSAITSLIGGGDDQASAIQVVQSNGASVDRINNLWDALILLRQERRTFTMTYDGKVYPGYLLTSIKKTKSAGEGGLARFQVSAINLATVQTGTAELPDPLDLRAKNKKKRGSKSAKEVESEITKKSLLASAVDFAGGLL